MNRKESYYFTTDYLYAALFHLRECLKTYKYVESKERFDIISAYRMGGEL